MKRTSILLGGGIALWAVIVAVIFFASTGRMVAATGGFFAVSGLLAATSWLALLTGFRILRTLEGRLHVGPGGWDPLERTAVEFGLGTGAMIAGMFVLGILGLYRMPFVIGLLGVLAIGNHGALIRSLGARRACEGRGKPLERFLLSILILVACMTFVESLTPSAAQDALAYHLAVPAKYIEAGGIHYIPESFFAQFPANVEMVFTLALLIWGDPLASAWHWLLGAGCVLAAAALARRLAGMLAVPNGEARAPGSPGLLSAAIFATVPTAALIAGWAYVDLGLVFFETLSTLAFLRWWELGDGPEYRAFTGGRPEAESPPRGGRMGWLLLAGVFAGLAAGCKYTGGIQGVIITALALGEGLLRRRPLHRGIQGAAVAALMTGILAAPWWIKSLIYTGNPLYPFLFGLFGGRQWDGERALTLSAFLGNWGDAGGDGLLGTLLLPWRLTMSARFFSIESFDGMIGPAFLIGMPAVLLVLLRPQRSAAGQSSIPGFRMVFAAAVGHAMLWLLLSRQIRFLLPAIALWAALIGASLPSALPANLPRAIASGALRIALAFNVLVISTHFAAHNPLPVVLGFEAEASYLEREVPGGDYSVFATIARELPVDCRILFGATGSPGFLCKRPYHADPIFENRTLAEILRKGRDPDGVLAEMERCGFTHLLFRWNLVFDPTGHSSEIPMESQMLLARFLNLHGRLLTKTAGTLLYGLERGAGPGAPER